MTTKSEHQENEQHWMLLVLILKRIAKKKGIQQQEIAERTGLKAANISRMFKLRFCPTLKNFMSVAQALNVNFYFEDQDGESELTEIFEEAMTELGRRPGQLPKN